MSDHRGPYEVNALRAVRKQDLEPGGVLKPGPRLRDATLAPGCQETGQLLRKMLLCVYKAKDMHPHSFREQRHGFDPRNVDSPEWIVPRCR